MLPLHGLSPHPAVAYDLLPVPLTHGHPPLHALAARVRPQVSEVPRPSQPEAMRRQPLGNARPSACQEDLLLLIGRGIEAPATGPRRGPRCGGARLGWLLRTVVARRSLATDPSARIRVPCSTRPRRMPGSVSVPSSASSARRTCHGGIPKRSAKGLQPTTVRLSEIAPSARVTEPHRVVGFVWSSVPYSPLVIAAWCPVSTSWVRSAVDSSER